MDEKKSFVIREDLDDMVESIGFSSSKTRYGLINNCNVKLFNGVVIPFRDNDKIFELFQSYVALGEKDFIKSKKLVEEQRVDDTGEVIGTYICVKYELTDDSVIRLFSNNFNIVKSIDNYYKLFKKEQKIKTTK